MRIGIVGAGMIGSTLAKLWVDAGHEIRIASRRSDQLGPLVERLGARASAGAPIEAAQFGNVVLLAVPLKAVPDLARELAPALAGRIVLDTSNAYERRDGDAARLAQSHARGSAAWAAAMFPGSRWVKAFNTVHYRTLESEARRQGDRVGIPLASDDSEAMATAARLVRDAGFDPVEAGPLAHGRAFEPGSAVYNTGMTGREVRQALGKSRQD